MPSTETLGLPPLDTEKLTWAIRSRATDEAAGSTIRDFGALGAREESGALFTVLQKGPQLGNAMLFVCSYAPAPGNSAPWEKLPPGLFDMYAVKFADSPLPAYLIGNSLQACKIEYLTGSPATNVTVPANPITPTSRHHDWLSQIKKIESEAGKRKAVSLVFRDLLKLAEAGSFSEVDAILAAVDPNDYSIDVALAFLAITARLDAPLPSRNDLYHRLERHLRALRGPNDVEKLLRGLR